MKQILIPPPFFSLIVPCHQAYAFYAHTLFQKISKSSFRQFECLVVTEREFNPSFLFPDDRFKWIVSSINNYAAKKNKGIKAATGEYLMFADADDDLDTDMLGLIHTVANEFRADFICPKVVFARELLGADENASKEILLYEGKQNVLDLFYGRYVSPSIHPEGDSFILDANWGRAYKKKIIDDYRLHFSEEPCRAEDALFNDEFALHAAKVCLLPFCKGYFWNRHEGSEMTRWDSPFLAVAPFCDRFHMLLSKVDSKYGKDEMVYLKAVVDSNVSIFASNYKTERNSMVRRAILRRAVECVPKKTLAAQALFYKPKGKAYRMAGALFSLGFSFLAMKLLFVHYNGLRRHRI